MSCFSRGSGSRIVQFGNVRSVDQLGAFEHKVRAQIAPSDHALADLLLDTVQKILDAVTGAGR